MTLLRAIATVGGFTMISRVTGFVRDMLIAAMLGAGPVADAFFVAFKLPNFFRRLTGEGAMTVAFVPIFAGKVEAEGKEAARSFAAQVQSVLLTALAVFLILVEIFMPWVMHVMAPGFVGDAERFDLAVELTRLTFPYLPLISLVALWGGMLNSLEKFWAMAAAPILLNLILIAALILFAAEGETPGHVLAWGVMVAGFTQATFLFFACRKAGILPSLCWPRLSPEVKRFLKLMLPAALGAGVMQVNLLIDIVLASMLPAGAISYLYYADRVVQLPLGVVGVAIGTALLPLLSRQLRRAHAEEAMSTQNRAIEFGLLLTLPAAAALAVMAEPVTSMLFERGAFSAADRSATAATMVAFSTGLPAFVLIKALQPGFFAREDTKTPVKVAVLAVFANLAFNAVFIPLFAHVGIALSTTCASWMNAVILATILIRRGHLEIDRRLLSRAPRILLSALIMACVVYGAVDFLAPFFITDSFKGVAALAGTVIIGLVSYGLLAFITGGASLTDLRLMMKSRANNEPET